MRARKVHGAAAILAVLAGGCDVLLGLEHRELLVPDGGGSSGATTATTSTSGGSTCSDGVKNGGETDKDCGGECPPCGPGDACAGDTDCKGGACSGGICQPSCTDGAQNGAETGIDCGGPGCAKCDDGMGCTVGNDCQSGVCQNKVCLDNYPWSESFGEASTTLGLVHSVATDKDDNVLITGTFSGTIDFGGGVLKAQGNNDVFLAKFDASGAPVWSFEYGGVGGSDTGYAVTADKAGNIFFTGEYSKGIDFGIGCSLSSMSTKSVFVVKLDPFGVPQWCKSFGLTGVHTGRAIAVDGSGNVIVAGALGSKTAATVDFGKGVLTSAGSSDAFVVKLDSSGGYLWAKNWGDDALQAVSDVGVDAMDNVVISGVFESVINFGDSGGALICAGGLDAFLAKFSPTGTPLWSKGFGSANDQIASGLVVAASGNAFLAGSFIGSIDCGGNAMTSAGASDLFVCEFDTSGAPVWSKAYGDVSSQDGALLAADSMGNLVLTSNCSGTVNFGGGPLASAGGPNGGQDIFVAKLTSSGAHIWSQRFGDAQTQYNGAVAVDNLGATLIAGSFTGALTFGSKKLTSMSSAGDIFLAKLLLP